MSLTIDDIITKVSNEEEVLLNEPDDYNTMVKYLETYKSATNEQGERVPRKFRINGVLDFQGKAILPMGRNDNSYFWLYGGTIKNAVCTVPLGALIFINCYSDYNRLYDISIENCEFLAASGDAVMFYCGGKAANTYYSNVSFSNNNVTVNGNYTFMAGAAYETADVSMVSTNSSIHCLKIGATYRTFGNGYLRVIKVACIDDIYIPVGAIDISKANHIQFANGISITYGYFRPKLITTTEEGEEAFVFLDIFPITNYISANQVYIAIETEGNFKELETTPNQYYVFQTPNQATSRYDNETAPILTKIDPYPENGISTEKLKDPIVMRNLGWNI